ncbi:MAG: dimethyl sulfoxide reductase anchor subunit [Desulfovibrio sp.]|nr:dimethyl sulfoxide reductase anchor subunit [Desulfovibrio sp.]
MSFEFPLVFFTVLTQLACGMAIFLCWRMWINPDSDDLPKRRAWLWTGGVAAVGLIASLCHLGQPFQAYMALINLGASSLSWEVLAFSCFTALAFLVYFVYSRALALLAAIIGAVGLFTQGLTYAPPSMPAINNVFPMVVFWLSAIALGASSLTLIRSAEYNLAGRLAMCALIAVLLIAPSIWLSGSTTMRETGLLWLKSGGFWCGAVLILLAFVATWFDKGGKILRFASLFCGVFLTRMIFFSGTVHTASNMGLPFN